MRNLKEKLNKTLADIYNISHIRIDIPQQSSIFYFPMFEEKYRFPYEIKNFPEKSKKINEHFNNFKVITEKQSEDVDQSGLKAKDCNVVCFEYNKAVYMISFQVTQIEEVIKFLMRQFERRSWREHLDYFFEMKDLLHRHKYPHFSCKEEYEIFGFTKDIDLLNN
jgi:hypothetical protein